MSYAFSLPDSLSAVIPRAGSTALEFRIKGLFNLDSHLGNSITLKTFTGVNKAVRIGIYDDVTLNDESGRKIREEYYDYQDTLEIGEADLEKVNNHTVIQVNLEFIRYQAPITKPSIRAPSPPESILFIFRAGVRLPPSFWSCTDRRKQSWNNRDCFA